MVTMCERDICIGFAKWCKLFHPSVLMWHTANERKCSIQTGMKLKAMGVLAGVPDYSFIAESHDAKYHMLMLEVKTAKGRLSPSQKAFRDRLPGWVKFVCAHGLDECIAAVNLYILGSKK